jgi:hypothetical protein
LAPSPRSFVAGALIDDEGSILADQAFKLVAGQDLNLRPSGYETTSERMPPTGWEAFLLVRCHFQLTAVPLYSPLFTDGLVQWMVHILTAVIQAAEGLQFGALSDGDAESIGNVAEESGFGERTLQGGHSVENRVFGRQREPTSKGYCGDPAIGFVVLRSQSMPGPHAPRP